MSRPSSLPTTTSRRHQDQGLPDLSPLIYLYWEHLNLGVLLGDASATEAK